MCGESWGEGLLAKRLAHRPQPLSRNEIDRLMCVMSNGRSLRRWSFSLLVAEILLVGFQPIPLASHAPANLASLELAKAVVIPEMRKGAGLSIRDHDLRPEFRIDSMEYLTDAWTRAETFTRLAIHLNGLDPVFHYRLAQLYSIKGESQGEIGALFQGRRLLQDSGKTEACQGCLWTRIHVATGNVIMRVARKHLQ